MLVSVRVILDEDLVRNIGGDHMLDKRSSDEWTGLPSSLDRE